MIYKYKKTKWVKQENGEEEIDLPTETCYYFQTGVRRSLAIFPIYSTWNEELKKPVELYEYEVISVYQSFESRIVKEQFRITDILNNLGRENKDRGYEDFLEFLIYRKTYGTRTKERFMADYNAVIDEHKKLLQ